MPCDIVLFGTESGRFLCLPNAFSHAVEWSPFATLAVHGAECFSDDVKSAKFTRTGARPLLSAPRDGPGAQSRSTRPRARDGSCRVAARFQIPSPPYPRNSGA